jgi:hypothetical protein
VGELRHDQGSWRALAYASSDPLLSIRFLKRAHMHRSCRTSLVWTLDNSRTFTNGRMVSVGPGSPCRRHVANSIAVCRRDKTRLATPDIAGCAESRSAARDKTSPGTTPRGILKPGCATTRRHEPTHTSASTRLVTIDFSLSRMASFSVARVEIACDSSRVSVPESRLAGSCQLIDIHPRSRTIQTHGNRSQESCEKEAAH